MAALAIGSLALFAGCAHRQAVAPPSSTAVSEPAQQPVLAPTPKPTPAPPSVEGWTEKGLASWYGEPYHGRRTASGEVYDMHEMTAAHKTLAFGSVVKVRRRDTGAEVEVRINDRGPFIEGRIIDLSFAAAKRIDLVVDGVTPVKIRVVGHQAPSSSRKIPAPEPENCFWVQVGAFTTPDNARRAESDLERSGEEAVVLEGLDHLWRVRVGPFGVEKEAEKARNRVTDAWPGAHILPCGG